MPSVEIRVLEVETIIKKFDSSFGNYTPQINLKWLKDWCNFGEVDTRINNGKFEIFNYDEDIAEASISIKSLFEEYGLKYIEKYGSVAGLDKMCNLYPENDNILNYGFHTRSINGIIAAKLVDNHRYKEIVEIYTQRINQHALDKTMNLDDIERFFKVKDFLG